MLEIVKDNLRLLTFRSTREEILSFNRNHLIFGLICAWVVGIGRYWDNPRVGILQHLGIGSVIYIFALALFLWLLIMPLKAKDWSYFRVLTLISMVSPPASLYSIPVEMFTNLETANSINACFLFIVAAWRVALLIFFLRRLAQLDWTATLISAFLPITIIVVGLVSLNLEKVVFNIMGGMDDSSPNQTAYGVLFLLSIFSVLISPIVLITYIVLIIYYGFQNKKLIASKTDEHKD